MSEKDMRERMAAVLKSYRLRANMTVYEVGEKVGKSGKTVDAWEHGRGQPDADMLLLLCDLYGVPSVGAFFGEDKMPVTDNEYYLLRMFRALNREGQKAVLDHATALVASGLYKKSESSDAVI